MTDLRMPEIDGLAVYDWLMKKHPALAERTLFVTGTLLDEEAMKTLRHTGRPHLEKPFRQVDLRRALVLLPVTL